MFICHSSEALPSDFFETVLELESSIKTKFDLKKMQQLIEQYTLAMEHYSFKNDDKRSASYKKRIEALLQNPEMLNRSSAKDLKQSSKSLYSNQNKVL